MADSKIVVPMQFRDAKTAGVWAATFTKSPRFYVPIFFDVNIKAANSPMTPNDEAEKSVRDYWGIVHNRWMLYVPQYFMHPLMFRRNGHLEYNRFFHFGEAFAVAKEMPKVTPTQLNRVKVLV